MSEATYHGASTFSQVGLIAWLRWRLFVAMLRAPGAKSEMVARMVVAIAGLIITGLLCFGLGAVGFAVMKARPDRFGRILWGIFLVAQFLPVLISATSSSFDTRTLLRFPLRFSAYVALALSYSLFDPVSLSTLLWLLSVAVGATLALPKSGMWIFSAILLLAAFSILLNRWLMLWMERWMARRRAREILFLVVIGGMLSLQLLGALLQKYEGIVRLLLDMALPWLGIFPPGIAGGVIANSTLFPSTSATLLAALALWCGLAALLLRWRLRAQFRGEDWSEAVVSAAAKSEAAPLADLPARIPFLTEQRAALVGKELRYLFRNAVTLLQLGVPFVLIIFFGLTLDNHGKEFSFFQRRPEALLPSAMGYAIFISLPIAHNSLSFESWGLQLLYLAPVRFREVLIAKNMALGLAILGQALGVALMVHFMFGGQQLVIVVASFVAMFFMLLLNFSLGNMFSLYFPRPFDFGSFRQRQSPWSVLAGMLTQIVGMAMIYLVYAIALWRGSPWYAVLGYALMGAGMFQVYLLILERAEEIAGQRRELILQQICRDR